MKIISIVAADQNRLIGTNNQIPWRLKNDLRYFKRTTVGHFVLMGRKSFESLGKPLKDRTNIIITRNQQYSAKGINCFSSIEEGVKWAREQGAETLFIAGGGEIYKQSIDLWDELYYTDVDAKLKGQVYFPDPSWENWELYYTEFFKQSDEDEFDFTIKFFKRK